MRKLKFDEADVQDLQPEVRHSIDSLRSSQNLKMVDLLQNRVDNGSVNTTAANTTSKGENSYLSYATHRRLVS